VNDDLTGVEASDSPWDENEVLLLFIGGKWSQFCF
jgi:hypothetical protein